MGFRRFIREKEYRRFVIMRYRLGRERYNERKIHLGG